jgi:hypothetical protein
MEDIEVRYHSRAVPEIPVDHPEFVYHGSDDVDVQRTWRKFGWTPIVRDEVPPVNSLEKMYDEVDLANAYSRGWDAAMLRRDLEVPK